ncbi:MAG: GAF domain-containing protein [Myxococcota bacterium]|jgi:GAF domain-containing protein|nr:GAF domain-containing protein [Myxococcota bacterium]
MSDPFEHVRRASRVLLERGFVPEAIGEALRIVGEGARVDRVYVFERGVDGNGSPTCSQRYEWSATQVAPTIDDPSLQDVPFEAVAPSWARAFDRGEVVHGLTLAMEPDTRAMLEAQGILSVLACPIVQHDAWWGFVGFDDCHTARVWPPEEIAILRTLSRALAGALRHSAMRGRLAMAREQLRSLVSDD